MNKTKTVAFVVALLIIAAMLPTAVARAPRRPSYTSITSFSTIVKGDVLFLMPQEDAPFGVGTGQAYLQGTSQTTQYGPDDFAPFQYYRTTGETRTFQSMISIELDGVTFFAWIYSSPTTTGFFVDEPGFYENMYFLGIQPGFQTDSSIMLLFNGFYRNSTGSYSMSGYAFVISEPYEGDVNLFAVIFVDENGDLISEAIWTDDASIWGDFQQPLILLGADYFSSNVDVLNL